MPAAGRHYVTLFMLADGVTGDPQRLEPLKCDGWSWHDWDALPEPLFAPLASLRKSGWRPAPAEIRMWLDAARSWQTTLTEDGQPVPLGDPLRLDGWIVDAEPAQPLDDMVLSLVYFVTRL